jgi:tripartite-type tricarboxylate transporter receptor subunit TctC
MKNPIRKLLLPVLCALPLAASAQDWAPTKPVRIIVPIIGGTVDAMARLVQPKLQEAWGQPVVVENKAGSGGNIGADFVAKSPGDGHTLLVAFTAPITVNAQLYGNLPYDPLKDLAPITLTVSGHQFLVVHPSVPANTVAEFIAYAKANAGKLNYGSIAVGGASHLTMEMLQTAAGIKMTHVPYKGSAPTVTDLLGGQIQASFLIAGNVLPHLKSGRMKALASTGRTRFASTPNVPTMIESGFADFEAVGWIGFMAAGTTPKNIIDRWHRELTRIVALPEVKDRLLAMEFEVVSTTPEKFAEYIRWETPRWAKVVRDTGAKAN